MNLAFYTYFYGSNENNAFKIPPLPSLKYKCYYFTNNKSILEQLTKTKWIAIYDDKPTRDDLIESCMAGKHIKTSPHDYPDLNNYDYLCFLDSKLSHVNEKFVEQYIIDYFVNQDYALLIREHWSVVCNNWNGHNKITHNNIWREYNGSMNQLRYQLESEKYKKYINNQLNSGLKEVTNNFCACGFLIRNMKHAKMKEINNTWYQHIKECGIQDQISFFFINQLYKDYIYPFTENPFY
jgi:hypothetical protein